MAWDYLGSLRTPTGSVAVTPIPLPSDVRGELLTHEWLALTRGDGWGMLGWRRLGDTYGEIEVYRMDDPENPSWTGVAAFDLYEGLDNPGPPAGDLQAAVRAFGTSLIALSYADHSASVWFDDIGDYAPTYFWLLYDMSDPDWLMRAPLGAYSYPLLFIWTDPAGDLYGIDTLGDVYYLDQWDGTVSWQASGSLDTSYPWAIMQEWTAGDVYSIVGFSIHLMEAAGGYEGAEHVDLRTLMDPGWSANDNALLWVHPTRPDVQVAILVSYFGGMAVYVTHDGWGSLTFGEVYATDAPEYSSSILEATRMAPLDLEAPEDGLLISGNPAVFLWRPGQAAYEIPEINCGGGGT